MNIEHIEQQVIINEWQLGQQLNTAVHSGTREKFNLLLSFLSDDARDFAQFDVKSQSDEKHDEIDLRAHFKLPDAQPLVNEGPSEQLLAELNQDLQATNILDIRFKQLLTNEAILCKKVEEHLPADILDNLPLLKKQRINDTYQSSRQVSDIEGHLPTGIDANLLDEYKNLQLDSRPIKLRYS